MKRLRVLAVLAVIAAASGAASLAGAGTALAAGSGAGAVVGPSAGTWGQATEVPGSAALNTGDVAQVNSVSCPSAGNCAAGGTYNGAARGTFEFQAFVDSERNGHWGKAIEVARRLNHSQPGSTAQVNSVSCASAGNCAAGGIYTDANQNLEGFVVTERNGRWGQASSLGADLLVSSVSCPSSGNCTAVGVLSVDRERNGRWGKPIFLPGLMALDKGHFVQVLSLSCTAPGNCSAGGNFTDGSSRSQAFVDSERNGRWANAIEVPGSAALNVGGNAQVNSVSCTSAGSCAAGGSYRAQRRCCAARPFVVSERNGRWGRAIEVHGSGGLNANGYGAVLSVSCTSAGNCAAGGPFTDASSHRQAFVDSERDGRWAKAIEVPGSAALNVGGGAQVNSVSCPSPGNCAAGGVYSDGSAKHQAFVDSERNGRWANAIEVPGSASLNVGGDAQVSSVSCPSPGNCGAGGSYETRSGSLHGLQAFVVSQH
jgi:hypothetical protein